MNSHVRLIVMHIFIVIMVLIYQNIFAAEEYFLEDLYRIALERSEQVGISEQDLIIAKRESDKALSYLLPKISAFGEYTQYDEEKDTSSDAGSFAIQPSSSSSWGTKIEQSFSLGGREITNIKDFTKSNREQ